MSGIDGEPWGPRNDNCGTEREQHRVEGAQREAPRGYHMDDDGWWGCAPRQPRPPAPLGRKQGTRLAAVPRPPQKARIFISRCQTYITVDQIREYVQEIAGVESDVERIQSRSQNYASFLITVDKSVEDKVLDPDEWQEGLVVRPFRGFLRHHGRGNDGRDSRADAGGDVDGARDTTVTRSVVEEVNTRSDDA